MEERCRQEIAKGLVFSLMGMPGQRSAASGEREKPVPRILDNPFQTFFQVRPCDCTASNNRPLVGLDRIQLETLSSINKVLVRAR